KWFRVYRGIYRRR
nr:Chain A, CDT-LPS [unidentified]